MKSLLKIENRKFNSDAIIFDVYEFTNICTYTLKSGAIFGYQESRGQHLVFVQKIPPVTLGCH